MSDTIMKLASRYSNAHCSTERAAAVIEMANTLRGELEAMFDVAENCGAISQAERDAAAELFANQLTDIRVFAVGVEKASRRVAVKTREDLTNKDKTN